MVGYDPIYVLVVNNANITEKMYENSASMTYVDNDGDTADALTVQVEGKWDIVEFGDRMELWLGYASTEVWHVGTFDVQSVKIGMFGTTIRATAASFMEELKVKKNEVYDRWSVKKIVSAIAEKNGLKAKCNVNDNLEYMAQQDESDMHFLTRVAKETNALFKVKKDEIIFIERDTVNTHSIEISECYDDGPVFSFNNRGLYKSAVAQYHDSRKNSVQTVTVGKGKPVLRVEDFFETENEARRVARSELKTNKRSEVSGSLNIYGMDIVAGNKLKLRGDKRFDKFEFTIKKVTHTINGSGFSTELEFES